jgi:hypothetical protein
VTCRERCAASCASAATPPPQTTPAPSTGRKKPFQHQLHLQGERNLFNTSSIYRNKGAFSTPAPSYKNKGAFSTIVPSIEIKEHCQHPPSKGTKEYFQQ